MKKLDEKEWKAQPITGLFDKFIPGKGKGLNHLNQGVDGVNYIGATNRGNGVLCVVVENEAAHKLIQSGNCIGFIKNGDGAAGFAIYKREPFISTSDVIYGYANWLNIDTGLFFVAAQDMIEAKYSHGYKRNQQHLRGDRVMLPVTNSGEPDYEYMAEYTKQTRERLLARYREYAEKRIAELGEEVEIPALSEKEWNRFSLGRIFINHHGKRLTKAARIYGSVPMLTAGESSNGITDFISNDDMPCFSNVLTVDMFGNAFNHKGTVTGDDNIYFFENESLSFYVRSFIVTCINKQQVKFSYGKQFRQNNADNLLVMLPVTDSGEPDYAYMEQYAKNMMLRKYKQFLSFLDRSEETAK